MKTPITIMILEDESEVREALERDLGPFAEGFRIESAEDVEEARQVLTECTADGSPVGLVLCDHLLPGTHGVDFLVELQHETMYTSTRKVLVTGQAGLEDTIRAVNEAHLHHYIAKPWQRDDLHAVVREQLTEYVLETADNLLPYVNLLDGPRLLEAVSHRRADT